MKIIDFKYRGEYSFFEYRYQQDRLQKELLAPTTDTTLTRVVVNERGDYCLNDLIPFPGHSCIVLITSGWKNTKWKIKGNGDYRARCYTSVVFDSSRDVTLTKYCDNNEEMFIIQGNWHEIDTTKPRAFYKNWVTEEQVIHQMNKPKPSYIKEYSGKHSILDSDSDTTLVNMTDAGWWFQDQSFCEWWNPYVLSWRKANLNVLSWRSSISAPFAFGFETSPKDTAAQHADHIKKHFPKTKKIIYFGQCLGTPKAISTAIEANADQLYTSSTIFDPRRHRSKHLLELTPYHAVDALDTIENAEQMPTTNFLFKAGDAEEKAEHQRLIYKLGDNPMIKNHIVRYLDVWAPVMSNEPYSLFSVLKKDIPNTEIDMNFKEPRSLKNRIDSDG